MTTTDAAQLSRAGLARLLDHSVLKPESTVDEIVAGAEVVRAHRIGFYCVQPTWVKLAAQALAKTDALIVTVVGFPHGCDVPAVKAHAAELAVIDGAREVDMVINFGALISHDMQLVETDITSVVRAVPGIAVKVIIEAAALDNSEKIVACRIAVDAGAAFVKTSTGFHPSGGATVSDIRLMRKTVGPLIGVKASGGVRSLADVQAMLAAGANRIGTSSSAAILAALES